MSRKTSPVPSSTAAAASATLPGYLAGASELCRSMTETLMQSKYECVICTESIKHTVATWQCTHCFRVLHLYCAKKWLHSSSPDPTGAAVAAAAAPSAGTDSFRCPNCQCVQRPPSKYLCYCGKAVNPVASAYHTPHSCGDTCGRKRAGCPHPCALPCHPGPCADCTQRSAATPCPCGKTTYSFPCGKADPKQTCGAVCGKPLSCGQHVCKEPCHYGPCETCPEEQPVLCRCGKRSTVLPCGSTSFSCDVPCGKTLECGHHTCSVPCHTGRCPPCDRAPSVVHTCPCGKQPIPAGSRRSCMDDIPRCDAKCSRVLLCGRHTCAESCHEGPCPGPCKAKVEVTCPCGQTTHKVKCDAADSFRCEKKCRARLSCGRHECDEICCSFRRRADADASQVHTCRRQCQKQLPCGHKCTDPCHSGPCRPCIRIITEELYCRCGEEMLIPPQPCSTPPPVCHRPCQERPACGHDVVDHSCHYGPCPPCMVPVDKRCAGGHTSVRVSCSATSVVCSKVCAKPLPCGHACARKCHVGDCVEGRAAEGAAAAASTTTCGQKCDKQLDCTHKCASKCHGAKACPVCKTAVKVPCECGISTTDMSCKDYEALVAAEIEFLRKKRSERLMPPAPPEDAAAAGSNDASAEGGDGATTVPPPPVPALSTSDLRREVTIRLPCKDDCAYNRRLEALASVSRGGAKDGSPSQQYLYSVNLWDFARQDLDGLQSTERNLLEFVNGKDAEKMMPHMTRDRRAVLHELCYYFHVACESYDQEPQRSCYLRRTALTTVPPVLLSKLVHTSKHSREFADAAFSDARIAAATIIVFEEPPVGSSFRLSDGVIYGWLRMKAGAFVVVPYPRGKDMKAAVFASPTLCNAGYSILRRTEIPVVFRMCGSAPPPKSEGGVIVSTDANPRPSAGGAAAGGLAAGAGWADVLRVRYQQQQQKHHDATAKQPLPTSNRFDTFRGGPAAK